MMDDNTPSLLEVSGGIVTVTQRKHVIDTEGQAATDDLDTINGFYDGAEIILRVKSASRVVTAKNGTGNISIGSDCVLNSLTDNLYLMYSSDDGNWQQVQRNT